LNVAAFHAGTVVIIGPEESLQSENPEESIQLAKLILTLLSKT
jgi:hypothetical protein